MDLFKNTIREQNKCLAASEIANIRLLLYCSQTYYYTVYVLCINACEKVVWPNSQFSYNSEQKSPR